MKNLNEQVKELVDFLEVQETELANIISTKVEICPKCGSNYLKRHVDCYDFDTKSYVDFGYWHIYDELEAGRYTCENGHYFRIKETIVVNRFEAYSEFEII